MVRDTHFPRIAARHLPQEEEAMLIDCGRCPGRGRGCEGCLIKTLAETPEGLGDLTPGELRAIEVLEMAGFDVELLETPDPPVAVPLWRHPGNVA
ncbi:hypothetical protein [Actinoplanes sp. NPDC051494]|uniref:hypothetical protein n=1 Tax=Actinoplanes sp. NPDC051494 TaxID=3363907 RepID=UPI0037A11A24